MKDTRDIKKEYGYILRWLNGGDEIFGEEKEDRTFDVIGFTDYTYYLENDYGKKTIITDENALAFIKGKTTNAFRDKSSVFAYENYIELFEIMGIKKKIAFKDLMEEKGFNGNRLSLKTNIHVMTINDLKNNKTEFKNIKVDNAIKISSAFDMTIEDIIDLLY